MHVCDIIQNQELLCTKDNFDFKSGHVFDKKKKIQKYCNLIRFPFLLPFYKYHIRHGRMRLKVAF